MVVDVLLTTVLWMAQATAPQAQTPPVPRVELAVDVIANAPLHTKVTAYTRLLAKRQQTPSFNRTYPPITLEVIRLVNRNPRKPAGKQWDSIGAVNLGYDPATKEVVVEYCIDFCANDPRTGALDPKRRMISYRALEPTVIARLNQQLEKLKKYAE